MIFNGLFLFRGLFFLICNLIDEEWIGGIYENMCIIFGCFFMLFYSRKIGSSCFLFLSIFCFIFFVFVNENWKVWI